MNILKYQKVFSLKWFGIYLRSNSYFSFWFQPLVRLHFNELVGDIVELESFHNVGVEHEGAFENADSHNLYFPIFIFNLFVVSVDLGSYFVNDLLDLFPAVKQGESKSIMFFCWHLI